MAVILAAAVAAGAVLGFRDATDRHVVANAGALEFRGSPLKPAGELTLIGVPFHWRGEPPAGWYGLSTVEGPGCVTGCLRPLVRCPGNVRWCGQVQSVEWSRDGKRFALSVTSYGAANPYNGIHVIDVASGRDRQLRHGITACCDWYDLAWSPDGFRLASVTNGQIHVLQADGSASWALQTGTGGRDSSPTWSADGRHLAFATRPRTGAPADVHVIAVNGSGKRLLVRGASAPAWSPDGRTIAYTDRCGGIKLVTPAGEDVTPASAARRCRVIGPPGRATWSPDGARIAVAAAAGVYVMNRDGTGLTLVTTERGRGASGRADISWAPSAGAR